MDVRRMGYIRRQEHKRWKLVFMLNHVINAHGKVVQECLNTEKFELGVRYDKSFVPLKKSIVKQRALQHCLRKRRESRKPSDHKFGVYGGKPLYSYTREIDKLITEMHPKLRRLRQTEKALKLGIERGRLLDPLTIPTKIDNVFNKSENVKLTQINELDQPRWNKRVFKNEKLLLPPIDGPNSAHGKKSFSPLNDFKSTKSNFTFNLDQSEFESKREPRSAIKNKVSFVAKNAENAELELSHRENGKISRESSKGLLILPPIQSTKHMIKREYK